MDKLKQYYMTIYSVAYSSCGDYLIAANNYGDIAVFNLEPFLSYNETSQIEAPQTKPLYIFKAHNGPIYSIVTSKKLIFSGSIGEVKAWKWSDVKRKDAKLVWTIPILQGEMLTKPEVNAMVFTDKDNVPLLYVGCGDNNIHCFNVATTNLVLTLKGHSDYIHCLTLDNSCDECFSGSEDGSVRIWDARKGEKAVHIIEPYKHPLANRPEWGKWIGCLAVDPDDFLVCGGAPTLCIWQMRTLSPLTQFPKPDSVFHVAHFLENQVISAGSEPFINHWSFDGKLLVEMPTSASCIYSIAINSNPTHKILTAAGCSYKIDLCTDFRFKDFSLLFCDN